MEGKEKIYSDPIEVTLSETAEKINQLAQTDFSNVTSAFLGGEEKNFFTRSFIIRYFDEEVEINDMCTFRSEIDAKTGFLETEFFVEADLYYIELKSMGNGKLPEKVKQVTETFPLKSVSKSTLKVAKF